MYDAIGIGNAICDIAVQVEDSFLEKFSLTKGTMSLVDKDEMKKMLEDVEVTDIFSGGACANTIYYISSFGLKTAFIGRVQPDGPYGKKFAEDITNGGVDFINCKGHSDLFSGKSAIFITPDGERTMCTYLGCAGDIVRDDINPELIADSKLFFIEGYLWDQKQTIDAIRYAIDIAKENKVKIAVTLSDVFCVENHKDDFTSIFKNDADILFANENEMKAFFAESDFDKAYDKAKEIIKDVKCSMLVVTRSEKGALIITKEGEVKVPTHPVNPVDATGAGDAFAAGFITSYLKGHSLEIAADHGNMLACDVIKAFGARPNVPLNI